MFKRELVNLGLLTAGIFILVSASGWYLVEKLHQTSKMLAIDTLPGLVDAGQGEEQIYQDRRALRELLFSHTAAERKVMISLLSTNQSAELWLDYAKSIFEVEDNQNFQNMMLVRSNYLAGLPRFLSLVENGRIPEATDYFNGESRDMFVRYEAAVRTLFEYNVQQGRNRAESLLVINSYVKGVIAIFAVMLFLLGVAVGFRLALGSSRREIPHISNRET